MYSHKKYLLHHGIDIMLLFNTDWNCQQVTIRIIPRLQFHNRHQTIIIFVSSGDATASRG